MQSNGEHFNDNTFLEDGFDFEDASFEKARVQPQKEFGFVPSTESPGITDCTKQTACSCRSSTLGMVDLSPLADTYKARFNNILAETGDAAFFWNPCIPFTIMGTPCTDVAVCQDMKFATSTFISVGTQDSALFKVLKGDLILSYFANTFRSDDVQEKTAVNKSSLTFVRMSHFKLICDVTQDPGTLVAHGVNPDKFSDYLFTFTSVHSCPEDLKPKRALAGPAPSAGTCLLIVCIFGLVLYLSVGMLVQVLLRRQSGMNVIPHKDFWIALPGLIKDGCIFCVYKGKTSDYSNI
ncbi:cation-dependent mannose-6-phosphate receptor-like isoform X2 [Elysia marginata]|uniref:Cation-dependent mannose-6-phosphate receptor-like isoform X2 n=1 Tax=Elysia marginata TaxID=1093978 RepID=A0AAV4HV82_9GAST|nr:cation-dependent mannose-6-phosphate receptor-like isoform X2 [Elysia marginata]